MTPWTIRAVGALQDLIDIDELDEFNAVFPEHRVARAHLLLKDGSVLVSEPTEARGDPENPVGPRCHCRQVHGPCGTRFRGNRC